MKCGGLIDSIHSFVDYLITPRYAAVFITLVAAAIRLIPMRFRYLLGYDPYFHLAYIEYAQTHGWVNFFTYATGPWGFQIKSFHPLGLWMTPTYVYKLLRPFGVSLFNAFRLTPVIFGVLTVILVYFSVLKLYRKEEAFLSAFFLAVSFGHVFRSMAGYYRGDNYMLFWYGVALFGIALALFVRRSSWRYGRLFLYLIPGLSAGFAAAFWQAYYPIFAILLTNAVFLSAGAFLLKKDKYILDGTVLALSLALGALLANWIGGVLGYGMVGETHWVGRSLAKELGIHFGFIKDVFLLLFLKYAVPSAVVLTVSLLVMARFVRSPRSRVAVTLVFLLAAVAVTLHYRALLTGILWKLFPQNPIAETIRTTWGSWWEAYGVVGVLVPLFFLRFVKPRLEDFLLLGTFAVLLPMGLIWTRFLFIASPAVSMMTGIGLVSFYEGTLHFEDRLNGSLILKRSLVVLLALLIVSVPAVAAVQGTAATLKARPFMNSHWEEALTYLGEHSNVNDVVLTWWDHGHWVTYYSHRAPVAQGGPSGWVAKYYLGLVKPSSMMSLGIDYVTVSYDTLMKFDDVLQTAGVRGGYALVVLPATSSGSLLVFSNGPYSLMAVPGKAWDVRVSIGGKLLVPEEVFVEYGETVGRVKLSSPSTADVYAYINLNYGYAVIMNGKAFNTMLARLMFTDDYPGYYRLVYSDGGLVKIFRFVHPNVVVTTENGSVVLKFTNSTGTALGVYGYLDNGTLVYKKWFNVRGKSEFVLPGNLNGSVVVRYTYIGGKTVLDRGVFRIGDVLGNTKW